MFSRSLLVLAVVAALSAYSLAIEVPIATSDAPVKSWTITGPDGGDIRVLRIDPKDKNKIYVTTLDGQIFRSLDGAKTWSLLVNLNQPQLILDDLIIDSRDSNMIYASGHRHTAPGGFFRSTDGGATWKEAKELRKSSIHSLTQSTADPSVLIAGTTEGAWISRNSGADWTKISSSTMPVNIDSLAIDPKSPNTIYAGTWWRAYKTTDGGANWRLIKNGMIDDSDVFAVTLDPHNNEHVVASACSGIYESFNGGELWKKINGIPSQSRRTRDILQHPTLAGTIYAATTEGFWMTSNGGRSWVLTTQRNLEINSIGVHPDEPNRIYIATNNYGVMVSNDGGRNFAPTNLDLTTRLTYAVATDIQRPNRIYAATRNTATGGGFFFISDNGGDTWRSSPSIDVNRTSPFAILQDRTNPNLMYLGTNTGLMRSLDRGLTWNAVAGAKPAAKSPVRRAAPAKSGVKTKPVPKAAPPAAAGPVLVPTITGSIKVLQFTEDGRNGLLAGTDNGIYRSYDLTKGWEKLDLGSGINTNVLAIHVSPMRRDTIWVGTATSGVVVSHDDGKTWAKTGGADEGVPVSSIASDPERPDYIYVGTKQTFYLSRDNGKSWTRRGGNLPLGNFTSILIDPNNTDQIIISSAIETDGGIYISTDAGNRWKRMDGKDMPLPSRRVWTMAFDKNAPGRIFAGTHSSGVYRIDLNSSATASTEKADQTTGN